VSAHAFRVVGAAIHPSWLRAGDFGERGESVGTCPGRAVARVRCRMSRLGIRGKLVMSYLCLGAGVMLLSVFAERHIEREVQRSALRRMDLLRQTQTLASLASSASEDGFSYVQAGDVIEFG